MNWWCWNTRWNLRGDVRALFISACFDGFAEIFFLHERLDAEMQGFQNLDESAMNQLGSFRFSLQVATLELSETWSCYHWTGETGLTRFGPLRREGVKQPHATAKQNCAPKAALQSSASSYQIPTFQAPKDCTLHNKSQKKFTSSWIQSMIYKEISVSGSKHQLL